MRKSIMHSLCCGTAVSVGSWVLGFGPRLCLEAGIAAGLIVLMIGVVLFAVRFND